MTLVSSSQLIRFDAMIFCRPCVECLASSIPDLRRIEFNTEPWAFCITKVFGLQRPFGRCNGTLCEERLGRDVQDLRYNPIARLYITMEERVHSQRGDSILS